MKKRIIALSMIAAMSAALPGTVLAAETSQEQQISVTLTAEPEYTVTIPASVSMGNEGTYVDVTAEEITNLPEGKKISVTIAGTDKYNDQMVVEAQTSPRTSLRYQIISDDGELIETNASTGAAGVGKEVVSFTENGTKQYQIKPVISGRYEYGVAYTGSITFGIEVADAEQPTACFITNVEVPAAGETVDGFSLALVCATDGISAIIVKNAEKAKY